MAGDPLRQRVILWGGVGNGPRDDTWEWDGATWLSQNPVNRPPSGSVRSMVFEPTLGLIVLQTTASIASLDQSLQTWLWIGTDWVRLPTATQPQAGVALALTAAPGRIYNYDGDRLYELLLQPPLASSYGASCPSSGPRLFVDTWPRGGAVDFGLSSAGHAANTAVLFVVGTAAASTPVAGCTLLVQPGGLLTARLADAAGVCTLAIPLPALPALVGLRAFGQAWSLCPTGACATNGVDVTIGG
jgi:hypothetical protein